MTAANLIAGIELTALLFSLAFLAFLPIELVSRWRRRQLNWQTVKEMLASSSPLILTILSGGLVIACTACYSCRQIGPGVLPVFRARHRRKGNQGGNG